MNMLRNRFPHFFQELRQQAEAMTDLHLRHHMHPSF